LQDHASARSVLSSLGRLTSIVLVCCIAHPIPVHLAFNRNVELPYTRGLVSAVRSLHFTVDYGSSTFPFEHNLVRCFLGTQRRGRRLLRVLLRVRVRRAQAQRVEDVAARHSLFHTQSYPYLEFPFALSWLNFPFPFKLERLPCHHRRLPCTGFIS